MVPRRWQEQPCMKRRIPAKVEPRLPWIVAHRGARKAAPDNSRSAFDTAIESRVEGIEFDVQLTLDDIPVLYHDRTLARVGGGRRRVSDFTLQDLRSLDWGGWFDRSFRGEPLMKLESALRRYARLTRLFIEVKSRAHDRERGRHEILARGVVDLIRKHVPPERLEEGVFLLSKDWRVLDIAAANEPRWNYVLNVEAPGGFAKGTLPRLARLAACCLPVRNLTPSFAGRIHRRGLMVMTYACNRPFQVRRALTCRADVIMTDDPSWLVDYLHGSRPR